MYSGFGRNKKMNFDTMPMWMKGTYVKLSWKDISSAYVEFSLNFLP